MPSQGPLNPYVAAESAGADGISPWTGASNALASGGSLATSWSADSFYLKSYYLILSDFQDASMDDSDTIDGVLVETRAAAQDADRAALSYVALRNNGVVAGTPKTTSTNLSTSQTYISRGGASDAFGATLTGADVKASTFQIALQFSNVVSSTEVQVDHVRVTFYYTAGGGTERRAYVSHLTLAVPDTSGTAKSWDDDDTLVGVQITSVSTGSTERRARISYATLAMPEVVAKTVSDTDTLVGVQTAQVTAPDLPLVEDDDTLTGTQAISVTKRLYSDYSNTDEAITPAVEGSTDFSVNDVVPLVGIDTILSIEATSSLDDTDTLVGTMASVVTIAEDEDILWTDASTLTGTMASDVTIEGGSPEDEDILWTDVATLVGVMASSKEVSLTPRFGRGLVKRRRRGSGLVS
jgi:hypothetical protein